MLDGDNRIDEALTCSLDDARLVSGAVELRGRDGIRRVIGGHLSETPGSLAKLVVVDVGGCIPTV